MDECLVWSLVVGKTVLNVLASWKSRAGCDGSKMLGQARFSYGSVFSLGRHGMASSTDCTSQLVPDCHNPVKKFLREWLSLLPRWSPDACWRILRCLTKLVRLFQIPACLHSIVGVYERAVPGGTICRQVTEG